MRRLFRWAIRIVLGLILLAVAGLVMVVILLDTITREVLVNRLRSLTGMEVKISSVHVGLLSPTISIEGLKLYNPADFGGSLCLDMPELHLEYDASALRAGRFHVTLLRLDLAELSVVVDKSGRRSFDTLKKKSKESNQHKSARERLKFTGIDVLNVSLGKARTANLASGRSEEIDFGVKNKILRNVKSWSDLSSLGLATLPRGKSSSSADADADMEQLLESLLKSP